MMVATKSERILRIRWDGAEERDFSLDLKRIPFSINQQVSYGSYCMFSNHNHRSDLLFVSCGGLMEFWSFFFIFLAVPLTESNTYVSCMEYSPLIGGFAIALNDGRAAYLTANSLKFDPNVSNYFFEICDAIKI